MKKLSSGIIIPEPDDIIEINTVQHWERWEKAKRNGRLVADGRRITHKSFRPSYKWMMAQMKKRIPGYSGRYPVWCYYGHRASYYERMNHYGVKAPHAFIHARVPASRVLLSDFGAWHCILNRQYLSLNQREDRAFDKKVGKEYWWYEYLSAKFKKEIEKSWERIFDLKLLDSKASNIWFGKVDDIQGVIEYIDLSEVKSVSKFNKKK